MAAVVPAGAKIGANPELGVYVNQDGVAKYPGCHPTPGMLHQTTGASPARCRPPSRGRAVAAALGDAAALRRFGMVDGEAQADDDGRAQD